ncbi:SDR family NAD(P)-dependent oxidoreductase [Chloroflexota bacterium]
MGMRLKDKVAVITGSGRGLGRTYALLMAEEGAKVVVCDVGGGFDGSGASQSPADEVVEEIRSRGGTAVANYDSVATGEGGENMAKTALDNFGRLDILVNGAGITRDRMIFNMADEEWDAVMKVHLYGHFYCTRSACRVMRQQKSGRIINIGSRIATGSVGQCNYGTAKAAIVGLTYSVARDMGKYGVTCNCVFPLAATRLMVTPDVLASMEKRKAAGVQTVSRTGEQELPDPETIAPMVVYLATDQAADINGQVFFVSGAEITHYAAMAPTKSIFTPADRWTLDELAEVFPATLGKDLINPAPPQPPKEKPTT